MHSAMANDYVPNGPLLLVCTHLLLDALPQPAYWGLLETIPACKGTSKTGAAGDPSPPQGDAFTPQPVLEQRAVLPGQKGMGKGRERAWTTHGWEPWQGMFPTVPCLVGSCSGPSPMPRAGKMTKAMATFI